MDRRVVTLLLFFLLALLGACGEDEPGLFAASGGGVLLVAPEDSDPVVQRLNTQASDYLTTLTGITPAVHPVSPSGSIEQLDELASSYGAGLVIVSDASLFYPDRFPPGSVEALPPDGFRIVTEDRGGWHNHLGDGSRGATYVLLTARTKLAKQYAIYEALRRLGVRYYHPEQEYVPRIPASQVRDRARTPTVVARRSLDSDGPAEDGYAPDFRWRSFTFHGSHPLEHQEAFSDANHPIDEAVHVNEWIVKNRGNRFRGAGRGIASEESRAQRVKELGELRDLLGFPTGAGITLHNQQQGASAAIDPTRPEPVQLQIERYVEARLQAEPDAIEFGIHFGPTEFTVTPDEETVQWINWAGRKAVELRPDIRVMINDHTTGSQPTPHYDDLGCPAGTNPDGRGDYYDLAFHTDPRFGVTVHTVMFYPVEGPAHVYNQVSFAHKRCLMEYAAREGRTVVHFPEGSWWLSFDNPIPVYLPLYIWTRHRDIQLLKPLLTKAGGTLDGHRMFNSGHEWGYWQQDYAVGLNHWNADITLEEVIGELTEPFCAPETWPESCEASQVAHEVMMEVMEHQKRMLLDEPRHNGKAGGLYTYLAGEDPADEIAASTGLEFRPVRTSFFDILGWSSTQLSSFQFADLKALSEMQEAYEDWVLRLHAMQHLVPESGRPWFDEILDGLEINGLRAKQALQLYEIVVGFRRDTLRRQENPSAPDPASAAAPKLSEAAATLDEAESVIRRREAAYRYPPEQEYGGGLTPETAKPNGTTYPYRVHTKTHLLWYWTNRHDQVEQIVAGGSSGQIELLLDPVIAAPGEPLAIQWPAVSGLVGSVDLGDGTTVGTDVQSHDYPLTPALWPVVAELDLEGQLLTIEGTVVRSEVRAHSKKEEFALLQPDSELARSVLTGLVPDFEWAYVAENGGTLAFAPSTRVDGVLEFQRVVPAPLTSIDNDRFVTEPVSFELPIAPPGGGSVALSVGLVDTVLSGDLDASGFGSEVHMVGSMTLRDLIDALIALAGFDEQGAILTLADVLGFDPTAPPISVPFEATLGVENL